MAGVRSSPIAVVIFTQAASERADVPRVSAPAAGGALPQSAGVGLAPVGAVRLHARSECARSSACLCTLYYVAIAAVMGTGDDGDGLAHGQLAAAMGFHFINNIGALTVAGTDSRADHRWRCLFSPGRS